MSYFRGGDLVQYVKTGETMRWARSADDDGLLFGPGVLIPWTSGQSYAQDVIDAIGRDVAALEFDWPAPYDGEQRRAKLRIRRKAGVLEETYLQAWDRLSSLSALSTDLSALDASPLWRASRRSA